MKRAKNITKSCSEYGFFQIVNHGVPFDLMKRAIELFQDILAYPEQEKRKSSPAGDEPLPAGYSKQPDHFPPGSTFNVFPTDPPEFKELVEEIFTYLSVITECLGLPHNFLKEFNHDRSWDFLTALRYYPATETENNGISGHEDGNCITIVLQDDVGGLQVLKNGYWIPVTVIPVEGTLVVNISDVIQVLSNNKFKSATHRVVRVKGRSRHSYAFFYNLHGDKWVEPLPEFSTAIGEAPKYRGYLYKEFQALRMRNKTPPPARPEDVIDITHYAIP